LLTILSSVADIRFLVSASPAVSSTGGVGTDGGGSVDVASEGSGGLSDVFAIEVTRRHETVYLNSGDLIDGDLSVETDDDGLTRV
jgi:hypothetical protein